MAVPKTVVAVLDCAEPEQLAEFYAGLLHGDIRPTGDPDLIEVAGQDGSVLAFRRDPTFIPPSWPRSEGAQQVHLVLLVGPDDMDAAEREAVNLGALPMEVTDVGTARETRLMSDQAGHAFLLRTRRPAGSPPPTATLPGAR
ncbi:VOC family protein [Streptomyces sp. NPDC026672]|uniref:VOC family protein n=1 Tax=unclassified Streptomyces TaxID=2593676 RepID=UPI0033EC3DF3